MIKRLDNFLEQFSKWGIVLCLFLMLLFSVGSIVLRWINISFHWLDPAVRHLVFFATFLGGSLATGSNQNIKIDLLTRLLEGQKKESLKHKLNQLITLETLVIVLILAKVTWEFAKVEAEFGKNVFLGIHSSVLVGIIPFGFLLISLRLFCRFYLGLHSPEKMELNK